MKICKIVQPNLKTVKQINGLKKNISDFENKLLKFDIKAMEAIYRIKINKSNYKKYKLG